MKQISKRARNEADRKLYDEADAILEHALARVFEVLLEVMHPPEAITELRFLAESLDRRIDLLLFNCRPKAKGGKHGN